MHSFRTSFFSKSSIQAEHIYSNNSKIAYARLHNAQQFNVRTYYEIPTNKTYAQSRITLSSIIIFRCCKFMFQRVKISQLFQGATITPQVKGNRPAHQPSPWQTRGQVAPSLFSPRRSPSRYGKV